MRSGLETHGVSDMKPSKVVVSKEGKWNEHEEEEEKEGNTSSLEFMQQQPNYQGSPLVTGFATQGKFMHS